MKVQRYREHIAKQHADAQEAREEEETTVTLETVGSCQALFSRKIAVPRYTLMPVEGVCQYAGVELCLCTGREGHGHWQPGGRLDQKVPQATAAGVDTKSQAAQASLQNPARRCIQVSL